MAILYGVLRGRPDRYKREDNTSTPHLQIRILENSGKPWRIAVNVQSDSGSNVAFWVVDPPSAPSSSRTCTSRSTSNSATPTVFMASTTFT